MPLETGEFLEIVVFYNSRGYDERRFDSSGDFSRSLGRSWNSRGSPASNPPSNFRRFSGREEREPHRTNEGNSLQRRTDEARRGCGAPTQMGNHVDSNQSLALNGDRRFTRDNSSDLQAQPRRTGNRNQALRDSPPSYQNVRCEHCNFSGHIKQECR